MLWLWLFVGFMSSAVTLHIATLLLLDNPSFAKAAAAAASVWVLAAVFAAAHVGGLLLGIAGLVVSCMVLKRLYGIGTGQALIIMFLHAIVEIAIGAVLWFTFPSLLGRPALRHHAAAGSGCPAHRARV